MNYKKIEEKNKSKGWFLTHGLTLKTNNINYVPIKINKELSDMVVFRLLA